MTTEEKTMSALEMVNGDTSAPAKLNLEGSNVTTSVALRMDLKTLKEIAEIAVIFSKSQLVADCYRGEQGRANAFVALSLGYDLGISPFMALNEIVVIKGRPSIQGRLAIALINQRAPIIGSIMYEEGGEGDDQFCEAYCIEKTSKKRLSYRMTMGDAKIAGWLKGDYSYWHKDPKLMLRYRSASYLERTHFPGVLMGLMTTEEIQDINNVDSKKETEKLKKEIGLSK